MTTRKFADRQARKRDADARKRDRARQRKATNREIKRTRERLRAIEKRERDRLKQVQRARNKAEKQRLRSQQNARTKHALGKLKKRGLYKGDARKAPTRYGKSLVSKLSDVLKGKAAVLKTDRTTAKKFRDAGFRVKGNKVVVPKDKGEHVQLKKGQITSKRKTATGQLVEKIIEPREIETVGDLPTHAPDGRPYSYAVPFKRGRDRIERFRFPNKAELVKFMQPEYDKRYPNWLEFVELELVGDMPADDELEDDIEH